MPDARDDALPRLRRSAATVVLVVILVVTSVAAADAADSLRGRGFVPTPLKTREELLREWDLNSDGKIDTGEAEVASSRMRRERAELRLKSGIDPLTGLPRGEPVPEPEPEAADADAEEPAEPDADREAAPPLPGTRVPDVELPALGRRQAEPRAAAPTPTPGSRAAADAARKPVTGGVRAGGLPARAGHGAGVPAASLNAGLPIAPKTRQPPAPQVRGGLVPTLRQPAAAPRPGPSTARPAGSRDMYDPY